MPLDLIRGQKFIQNNLTEYFKFNGKHLYPDILKFDSSLHNLNNYLPISMSDCVCASFIVCLTLDEICCGSCQSYV